MASVMTARHLFPARQARTTTRQQKNTAERQTTKRQTTSRPPGEHSALAPSSFLFFGLFLFPFKLHRSLYGVIFIPFRSPSTLGLGIRGSAPDGQQISASQNS